MCNKFRKERKIETEKFVPEHDLSTLPFSSGLTAQGQLLMNVRQQGNTNTQILYSYMVKEEKSRENVQNIILLLMMMMMIIIKIFIVDNVTVSIIIDGFGGLVVSMLSSGT